ncbi:hypothetical protein, conserved [Eimeria necatrix]|uniref:Uncharacterized protein n=1 Tax=Eimeria necatrix TaxID=51315 RepID=U6MZE3_9EIME|nr:hypothetical protein, conserved [Eimeria necatrix]CDJ68433.1 hypothetical protein, conserved [Eimeria necatrix]
MPLISVLGRRSPCKEQPDESLKLPFPQHHANAVDQEIRGFPPHLCQAAKTVAAHADKHKSISRTRRRNRPLLVSLVSTVSLVAIIMLWYLCKAFRSTKQASGDTTRRLSYKATQEDGDEMSRILEQCLEMEEDLGIFFSRPQSPLGTEPPAKIAKLVSMLSKAATQHERMVKVASTSHETSTRSVKILPYSSSLQAFTGNNEAIPAPNLQPCRCVTMTSGSTGAQGGQETASTTLDNAGKPHCGRRTSSSLETPPSTGGKSEPNKQRNKLEHPYVRLPVLESDVIPRMVQPTLVFRPDHANTLSYSELHTLRNLFAKEKLNQHDADTLVVELENLASRFWCLAQRGFEKTSPTFASATLGGYFLAFDFIVRANEVLGDSMQLSAWWGKFISAFETDYSFTPPSKFSRIATRFHGKLAARLLDALRIYKSGKRPPVDDVIEIKRMLLFSPHSSPLFKDIQWDTWRADDYHYHKFPPHIFDMFV